MHSLCRVWAPVFLLTLTGCSSNDKVQIPPADITPPQTVENLLVMTPPAKTVTLTWRAPGDDGADGQAERYEFRYAADSLLEATWSAATLIPSPPTPGTPGEWQEFTIGGLPMGRWYCAMKAADEVPNWSNLSNVVRFELVDLIAPGRVVDLEAVRTTRESVTLRWTAPGDDGAEGTATAYDLRYATVSINSETWPEAVPAEGMSAPSSAGEIDSFTVNGLEPETVYWFALRTVDPAGNWSPLSNNANALTIGSSIRRLTESPAGTSASSPAFSPDGEQVVFAANWSGSNEIYRIPVNGGDPVRLTDDPADDRLPVWSPQGGKIAFISDRGGQPELWVMDAQDGASLVFLADIEAWAMFTARCPDYNPDGSRIAYTFDFGGTAVDDCKILAVPAEGGLSEVLIDSGQDWGNLDPAWSPDGTRLAVTSTRGWRWKVWVYPLDGGEPYAVTSGPAEEQDKEPCWSPDGSRLAFTRTANQGSAIWLVPSGGGAPVRLSEAEVNAWSPAWSPDGRRIAYVMSEGPSNADIWIRELE